MKALLVPNTTKPEALQLAKKAADELIAADITVLMDSTLEEATKPFLPFAQFMPHAAACQFCDVIITLGGDGTMLHTARDVIECQKPLLGINIGKIGFLTIVELDELYKLRRLAKGEFTIEKRHLLDVSYIKNKHKVQHFALNDAVLFKAAAEKTIALNIFCDEVKVSSFRGDGVVFATPTGSTAYSMSAGGPIVDAQISAIIVSQICAHIVQSPPMVFSGKRSMRAVQNLPGEEAIFLSCDGLASIKIPADSDITIKQAKATVPLIQFADADQLKSIDKKLKGR